METHKIKRHKKNKKKHKKEHKEKEGRSAGDSEVIEEPVEDLENRKRKAEHEILDYQPKKKKKKKLKDCREFEEDQDVVMEKDREKKRKRSLELEKSHEQEAFEQDHHRKEKERKSARKEKRNKNAENKKSVRCNEESLEMKSKKRNKGEKSQRKEQTEKQKLLEVVTDKANKGRRKKKTKEQVSTFDEDLNPIHFNWNPSEEIKQKFKIKQGRWTKQEEKILKENMEQYLIDNNLEEPSKLIFAHLHESESEEGKKWKEFARTTDFYRKLAKGLNRSIFFVYRKVLRYYDQDNYLGLFSESEDRELERLVTIHGKKWEKIGRIMGRSGLAVVHRYNWNTGSRGKWKASEVDLLREAVRKVTHTAEGEEVFTNINWNSVASIVKTRNCTQCRKKWLLEICWKECTSAAFKKWGAEEDLKLIDKIYESSVTEECDIDWYQLQKDFEMARSPEWLHLKFKVILKNYCNSIDLENTDFEDVIDYLYNVKREEIEDRHLDHQESSQE